MRKKLTSPLPANNRAYRFIMSKLCIVTITLTKDDNPTKWTDFDLLKITSNRMVVGYILKNRSKNSDEPSPILNMYVIRAEHIMTPDKIINAITLKNAFLQWLESLTEDPKSYMFRNPPLEEWLDTKQNWIKKITGKLSLSYNKSYDECLSSLYMTILDCYNKSDVYIGNLHYIIVAVNNKLRLEFRYMKNRLHGGHPDAIHLDAVPSDFNAGLDDSINSLHEIIGGYDDPYFEDERTQESLEALRADLRKEFSDREIDQIVNSPGFLPMQLYRKLLKWRKTHKREDYL